MYAVLEKMEGQSSGMKPREFSNLVTVVSRHWCPVMDGDLPMNRVTDVNPVTGEIDDQAWVYEVFCQISDYAPGVALQRQDAAQSHFGATRVFKYYLDKGFSQWGNIVGEATDRCSAQFACATFFGLCDQIEGG